MRSARGRCRVFRPPWLPPLRLHQGGDVSTSVWVNGGRRSTARGGTAAGAAAAARRQRWRTADPSPPRCQPGAPLPAPGGPLPGARGPASARGAPLPLPLPGGAAGGSAALLNCCAAPGAVHSSWCNTGSARPPARRSCNAIAPRWRRTRRRGCDRPASTGSRAPGRSGWLAAAGHVARQLGATRRPSAHATLPAVPLQPV